MNGFESTLYTNFGFYSQIFGFAQNRDDFTNYHDYYEDFTTGWSILNYPKKDKADFEWETCSFYLKEIYPAVICYILISEFCRQLKYKKIIQILYPLGYITYFMGYKIAFAALIQPILFYLVKTKTNKLYVWLCNFICLVLIAFYKNLSSNFSPNTANQDVNHFKVFLSTLLISWMNLKCTHFALNNSISNVIDYLAYLFYFPTLFTGPFISYDEFKKCYNTRTYKQLDVRLEKLAENLMRCLFWYIFVEFSLHYFYFNAAIFQLELIKKLSLCSLCGYGYLMGQFFHIKYIVLYGLSTSLASFENIPVPNLPRCIGRVHLYSDMWKYFDPGLHNFLKKSIFIPCQKSGLGKLNSSFLCFIFVFIWHGIEDYILIWATLNFIGIALEHFAINKLPNRRLKTLFAAPLLAMSAVSNFYFFAGKDIGDVFARKALTEPSVNIFLVLIALYCCCDVSTELRNVNAHKM
ncbi:unnamed protein product [Ceutorhynchus assimilis]|uniref:Protein-cysteine N-palmitoyltransferase Rasp n=1 Tax=Ceutorhynchus assimilis TaxID=467358 RepID=A0A9P0DJF4_9CUCU|nr:unnamed protein product [Ceutorhynchus assimilis]